MRKRIFKILEIYLKTIIASAITSRQKGEIL